MEGLIISITKAIKGTPPEEEEKSILEKEKSPTLLEQVSSKGRKWEKLLNPVRENLEKFAPKNEAEQRLLDVIREILSEEKEENKEEERRWNRCQQQ